MTKETNPVLDLFRVLSMFDWISPAIAIGEDLMHFNQPSWTFFIDFGEVAESGYSVHGLLDYLRQNGVDCWGSLLTPLDMELMFDVPLEQARTALYLLNLAGITPSGMSGAPPVVRSLNETFDFSYMELVEYRPIILELTKVILKRTIANLWAKVRETWRKVKP